MTTLSAYSIHQLEQEYQTIMFQFSQLLEKAGLPAEVASDPSKLEVEHLEMLHGNQMDYINNKYQQMVEVKFQLDLRKKQARTLCNNLKRSVQ